MVTDTPQRHKDNKTKSMWRNRPFTRVIAKAFKAMRIIKSYIRLNEMEARGKIPYRKARLKGLSSAEWELLWG